MFDSRLFPGDRNTHTLPLDASRFLDVSRGFLILKEGEWPQLKELQSWGDSY